MPLLAPGDCYHLLQEVGGLSLPPLLIIVMLDYDNI